MKAEGALNLLKLAGTSTGTGVVTSPFFQLLTSYVQQPVWGVPVTVMGAAAAGATLSLFFGDPLPTRRALFGQVLAATFFGAGVAVLLADGMSWTWATKNISMFAMISAAMIRWFLPSIIERGKQLIKEFKFSFTKKPGDDK
jgi:peptidoglycan/LPS O-acetylase OafA/YrhL